MGGEAKGRSWGPHREGLVTRERSPGIMQEEMGGGAVVCSAQVASCISCLVGLGEGFKRKVSMLTQIDSLTGDAQ